MTYFFRDSRGKGKKERKKAQAQEKKNGWAHTHTHAHTHRGKKIRRRIPKHFFSLSRLFFPFPICLHFVFKNVQPSTYTWKNTQYVLHTNQPTHVQPLPPASNLPTIFSLFTQLSPITSTYCEFLLFFFPRKSKQNNLTKKLYRVYTHTHTPTHLHSIKLNCTQGWKKGRKSFHFTHLLTTCRLL